MKYLKPTISSKKIKLNLFLTNITPLDRFHIIGDVYAGSGDCACGGGNCGCGGNNCAGDCGCGAQVGPNFGEPGNVQFNSSCNCACASNSGLVPFGIEDIKANLSCASNSNCGGCVGGCNCNSEGGQCNSGSGGGSGNSGSGSCNSGG